MSTGDVTEQDRRFMAAAFGLGTRELGRTWPNPAVGAIVVRDGRLVGRGWTQAGGRPHGEPLALAEAGELARGATLYVTLEPCSHHGKTPPCCDAIIAAGIARVVAAMPDPNPLVGGQGYARLRAAGIEVVEALLEDEARRQHAGHISRILKQRPHVLLKLAVSADNKAGFSGRETAITGEAVRRRVHMLRARHDAIAVGIGTVLADDPTLTCRLPGMEGRSPLRVVFDPGLLLPLDSQLVLTAAEHPVLVLTSAGVPEAAADALRQRGVEVIAASDSTGEVISLPAAMAVLNERGITRLMVEGGPRLAAALLKADLVDRAVIFESETVLGDGALAALPERHEHALPKAGLRLSHGVRIGSDTAFHYERG
ncbi:bifunctional diaminohydroxyphosphoribosylaminopyrimidine deaminase/5-amino-6-(5-phosphoribosylamino)uracil reductase RibD [Terrihabitans sp. PJ23]|uniref:Riboflavin biosynthesis protein RibD n=2 Tax=Terrihabitans rhizophilus TaxID=3092662 RepID=A0ABU4RQH7_9HYPH|nr:bifunctional diaminohydroxyphosphoribosylaminopyrimidine deaminase/5-amino-6-(5-phosphoribosylamino)uracil reductase RibD [Terrihabitans sp. PJ23]MDX6807109.1 bifunctional diaminohydroxyphosphoribosylaminopyrimidine deaminase/5-amino-6-(5-phosphoribosylamino)uracil reductase RibD [Terrihabitans sp. PJ23]